MTNINKTIIDGMTGVDKAVILAGRDARSRGAKVSDRVALANRLGVTRQAIAFFVTQGWMPRDQAAVVHDAYGVPIDELVKPA